MLKITKTAPDRVDISLNGGLDAQEMRAGLDDLIAKSEDVTNGKMLYTISVFAVPTMAALGVELSRLPKLFGLLGKFDKCAVLTDVGWLKTAAEIEGALIPGLEIKAFDLDEQESAEVWLAA